MDVESLVSLERKETGRQVRMSPITSWLECQQEVEDEDEANRSSSLFPLADLKGGFSSTPQVADTVYWPLMKRGKSLEQAHHVASCWVKTLLRRVLDKVHVDRCIGDIRRYL